MTNLAELSATQAGDLTHWLEASVPDMGPVQRIEPIPSPRNARRIAFFMAHGTRGRVEIAAKHPVRWPGADEGSVELTHLRRFRDAGSQSTPIPLGYDAEAGLLWTVVMPGVPFLPWLIKRLRSHSPRAEADGHLALRLAGQWLGWAQTIPTVGTPWPSHPFRTSLKGDLADIRRARLLADPGMLVVQDALARSSPWNRAGPPLVWVHGDFGPGNCLIVRSGEGLRVRVLDFATAGVGSPAWDYAMFSTSIAVSGAIRFISARRIARARAAFASGYDEYRLSAFREGRVHSPEWPTAAAIALHECAVTVVMLARYARRLLALPVALRPAVRTHVRHVVSRHLLSAAHAVLEEPVGITSTGR